MEWEWQLECVCWRKNSERQKINICDDRKSKDSTPKMPIENSFKRIRKHTMKSVCKSIGFNMQIALIIWIEHRHRTKWTKINKNRATLVYVLNRETRVHFSPPTTLFAFRCWRWCLVDDFLSSRRSTNKLFFLLSSSEYKLNGVKIQFSICDFWRKEKERKNWIRANTRGKRNNRIPMVLISQYAACYCEWIGI